MCWLVGYEARLSGYLCQNNEMKGVEPPLCCLSTGGPTYERFSSVPPSTASDCSSISHTTLSLLSATFAGPNTDTDTFDRCQLLLNMTPTTRREVFCFTLREAHVQVEEGGQTCSNLQAGNSVMPNQIRVRFGRLPTNLLSTAFGLDPASQTVEQQIASR